MNRTVVDRDGRRVALFEPASAGIVATSSREHSVHAVIAEPALTPAAGLQVESAPSTAEMILDQWAAMRVVASPSHDLA